MGFEIKITKDYAGTSPKGFLKKKVDASYNKIFKMIKEKRLTLNGKKIKQDDKLKEGDIIKCWLDDVGIRGQDEHGNREKKEAKDLGMKTIYEDEDLLILNKEAGVIVQGAQDNDTSLSLHLEYLKQKNEDNSDSEYFHAHRLDKDTSGVLVCGKNKIAIRELNKIFASREITKKYLCLCDGQFEEAEGKIEVNLDRNQQGMKEKMFISEKTGKKSLSFYKVISEFEFKKETVTLVEVEIKTGLTHQIRVHMKSIGHSIVGDKMYGNNYINSIFETSLDRQFLHAKSLEFEYKGTKHEFVAEFTQDLKNISKKLKEIK